MKRKILIILCVFLFITATFTSFASAEEVENVKSYYTIDAKSGYVIGGKEIEKHLPIASMVKIMTALIGFENVENGVISMSDKVIISKNASDMGGSQMFLEEGDEYAIEDLFKGIIVVSANDACVQLAETISGSQDDFVKIMNQKAKDLNLVDTHFENPHGLDSEEHYTTAYDLAKLAAYALSNETFLKICSVII